MVPKQRKPFTTMYEDTGNDESKTFRCKTFYWNNVVAKVEPHQKRRLTPQMNCALQDR
jgi:hypothetical protein